MKLSKDELRFAVIGPIAHRRATRWHWPVSGVALGAAAALSAIAVADAARCSARSVRPGSESAAFAVARFAGGHGLGTTGRGTARCSNRARSRLRRRRLLPGSSPAPGLLGLPGWPRWRPDIVIPLVIYIASYRPWVDIGNQLDDGLPAGHTGQTFVQLQLSMYDYHNNLRATHPATSPWWAWPLDLKPVWFEQGDYAAGTASSSTTAATWSSSGWRSRLSRSCAGRRGSGAACR